MATVVNFHGKNYIEPGAYAATVYNPTSVVNVSEFGNVLVIDTGLSIMGSYEFAGGSGVNGELSKGLKSVYEFQSYEDFLNFTGGGYIGDLVEKIFTPAPGVQGAPKLYYVRAATTKSAKIELTFEGTTITLKCKNEGIVGNGVTVNGKLRLGYSAKIISGTESSTFKVILERGSFRGVDKDGEPFGAKKIEEAEPYLIAEGDNLKTTDDLYNWLFSNKHVRSHFEVSKGGESKSLTVKDAVLASGGTTDYLSDREYANVLEAIAELNITFFLTTNKDASNGGGVAVNTNTLLFNHIKNGARFGGIMFIAGGKDDTDLFGDSNTSESIAKYYDSGNVVVTHGSPIVARKDRNGTKRLDPIYLTASILGLAAGAQPQTPLTYRRVGYQTFEYDLKNKEREHALQAGIMHVRNVSGYWVVNQGVTTLQENKKTIADDGQSFELSIEQIKHQLNKVIVLGAEARFVGNSAAKSSPESVKNFTETLLSSLVATQDQDNMILSWKNVKVKFADGSYFTTYDFVPNVPVNKLFFIGNIIDFVV